MRQLQESKEQALEEYEIIKRRLEYYDYTFQFEN